MPHQATYLTLRSGDFWKNLLVCTATGAVISIFFQKNYGGCGDYPQHFKACGWGLGVSATLGLGFNLLHDKIPYAGGLRPVLISFLRYFLAWIMLTYAVVKVIPVQFPYLLANMDSKFGELPPMRIAWTFFGYSKGYQMLMGWAEAIPALLLLFRRTYLLGALLMAPVLVNVVAVNVFFDVCVILNSSIYLGIALFLVISQYDRLWTFFFTEKTVSPQTPIPLFQNAKTHRLITIVNWVLVIGVLTYTAFMAWQAWSRYEKQSAKTPTCGIWQMEKMERLKDEHWLAITSSDSIYIDRLYLQGEHGVLKGPNRRDRIILDTDLTAQTIGVTFISSRNEWPLVRVWQYQLPDSNRLSITGRLRGDSVWMELVLSENALIYSPSF